MNDLSDNAADFSKALMELASHIDGEISKVIKKACIDLYKRIVERTPVDTGRARMNWQMSTSGHSNEKIDNSDGFSFNEIASHINEETSGLKLTINDDVVTIYNNVDYISYLESGHSSDQAPQGMVAISLAEFEQHFNDALSGMNI